MPLLEHSIKAQGALFVTLNPQFSPHQARDASLPESLWGPNLRRTVRPPRPFPRRLPLCNLAYASISILASHELQTWGKCQSHVSTDFSPLGQAVHQVGTAPALSEAHFAAGFHWPEWAEFRNGTSGSIVPQPSE